MRNNKLAFTALIVASSIGGFGNTLLAFNPSDPFLFVSLRFAIAAVLMAYWLKGVLRLPKRLWLAALLEALSAFALVLSLVHVSVALATVIMSFAPILALIANKFTSKQTVTVLHLVPAILGVISAAVLTSTNGFTHESTIGLSLAIVSTMFATASGVLNGWYGETHSTASRVALSNMIGAVIFLPLGLYALAEVGRFTPTIALTAFIVALGPGSLAKIMTLYSMKHLSVHIILQGTTVALVTATVSAAVLLGQSITLTVLTGLIVGVSAIFVLGKISQQ